MAEERTVELEGEDRPDCGTCRRPGAVLLEVHPSTDLYVCRCTEHVDLPRDHRREWCYTARGTLPFKLTKGERKQTFDGSLNLLKRIDKPDQEAGERIIVSWSKGGNQLADRTTGEIVYVPRQPRLWIVVKGWHLKAGSTEWETKVEIHDVREQNRILANGVGGMPREPGLKTRWGKTVASDCTVRDKHVPSKEEQHENWTPETERGYGGRNEMERAVDGTLVPSSGVDDGTIRRFLAPKDEGGYGIAAANIGAREMQRERERKMRTEMKLAGEHRRAKRQQARKQAPKGLDVLIAEPDGSLREASVEVAA